MNSENTNKSHEPRPVFISVLYRSGSTLLCLILNQSSELKVTYDITHYMRFSRGKYLPIEDRYPELIQDAKSRIKDKWKLDLKDAEILGNIRKCSAISESVVYDEMMKSFLSLESHQRWGDRTAVEWEGIPGFLEMFPKGKVIHVYRDPRAVLASYKKLTFHPGDQYLDAIFSSLAMFNFIEQEAIARDDRVRCLKYEDLIQDPEGQVRALCDFLEIPFEERMLDVSSFRDHLGKPFDANSAFTGPRATIDKASLEIWKTKLSRIDIYLTELILKEKMGRYGYEPVGLELTKEEMAQLQNMLNSDFLSRRYQYWQKHGDGMQAFPDTAGAYA